MFLILQFLYKSSRTVDQDLQAFGSTMIIQLLFGGADNDDDDDDEWWPEHDGAGDNEFDS